MLENPATGGNIWKPRDISANLLPIKTLGPMTMPQYRIRLLLNFLVLATLVTVTFIVQRGWVASFKPSIVDGNTFTVIGQSPLWQLALLLCDLLIGCSAIITIDMALNEKPPRKKRVSVFLITMIVSLAILFVAIFTAIAYGPSESQKGTTYAEWLADDVKTDPNLLIPPSQNDNITAYEGVDNTTVIVKTDWERWKTTVYTKEILSAVTSSSN